MKELEILYEDQDLILCRKPAGVATQTKRLGQQDMESLLKNYRAKKGEIPYIGLVHRLDQPVEGLMVFGKNQKATAELSRQVQNRLIGKHYYALSYNGSEEEQGTLEDYLITDKKNNVTRVVEPTSKEAAQAKKAKLSYRILESKPEQVLFDIELHTGRQHQIRVQLSHLGCPIIGDEKYGASQEDKKHPLALCSYRLTFTHPTTKKQMDFQICPSFAEGANLDNPG